MHWWILSVAAGPVRPPSVPTPRGPAAQSGCCRAAQVPRRLSAWSWGLWGLRYWWWVHWAVPHQLRTWGSGGPCLGSSAWLWRERWSDQAKTQIILNIRSAIWNVELRARSTAAPAKETQTKCKCWGCAPTPINIRICFGENTPTRLHKVLVPNTTHTPFDLWHDEVTWQNDTVRI